MRSIIAQRYDKAAQPDPNLFSSAIKLVNGQWDLRSGGTDLTETERALWRDPERLARIEAVLDDPSLAVPLDELD